ncbi:MAG: class I SAM-dependent methyltransferase [Lachnospiraceae bacterium]|nr:class I SAM-dependent methyltransferase [Lachnospiraceae bacterium]MCM1240674.1 class I SAM-dependent methyltransferase [Lachnospiraceae bacterium]
MAVSGGGKNRVTLSGRLRMLADMVTAGGCAADVGCDHGFLPIYLVQTGKCPKCLAMDVRKGPLSGAKEHIASCGMGEYIETRLSDGLAAYHMGEAQTLICAGMGGRLMERILREGGEKSRSFQELILQPQSEIPEFRIFLRKEGFLVTQEDAVCEDGKFYFAMKAVYAGQELPADDELYDLYGKLLLLGKHPVLKQYLSKQRQAVEELITRLCGADSGRGEARIRELSLEKAHLERALEIVEKGR